MLEAVLVSLVHVSEVLLRLTVVQETPFHLVKVDIAGWLSRRLVNHSEEESRGK